MRDEAVPEADPDEARLLARLRARDPDAFEALVGALGPSLLRVARMYARNPAVADEIVQEAWLAILTGLDRFEGRSSLRTWAIRIVMNIARTRASREARQLPFSAFAEREAASDEAIVEPDRFVAGGAWDGHWVSLPARWDGLPELRATNAETMALVRSAIEALSPTQRAVITLRDIEGWESDEVCNALEISATNQRVLLHRARGAVRRALDAQLETP